jgi:HlyD family secretion protein
MKKILFASFIVAVLGIVAFLMLRNGEQQPKFRTEKVGRGEIQAVVSASGTVNAVTTVLVGTQVSGTIKNIYADYNSPVTSGQLIAQIDPAIFLAQVEQARANLLAARANVAKAEAALLDAQRVMRRNRELFARNLIPMSESDTAETNYQSAQAQVQAARAQVAQTEAALKLAETNLRYTRILSPVDGIVVQRNVDVGQTVAASFQTPTLFTIAQDLTKMQVDTNVDEADIGRVVLGQPVEFTVDAYSEVTFRGKVEQIRISPISVQNVVTYDVVVMVDNPELKLKPGMTANVEIITAVQPDVLKIPNAALRFRPTEKDTRATPARGPSVYFLEHGKPKRMGIQTGISDGTYTQLVAGDIREGQELIVESLDKKKTEPSGPRGPRFF